MRAAASAPLFQMFCLLDGVGDPELMRVAERVPVNLERAEDVGFRAMMPDDCFESYWLYAERRGAGDT